ncbi:NYN domain-containing protein [Candidatus Dojkabacteria bacterium]|nr:NYN domain-containing protein [Candidatus Dojkabacteria bacterium]
MIVRNKDQRVAVLVDVQNLYYSARNFYNSRISFKNLLKIAVADRVLTRAIAYVIQSDTSEKEFFNAVHEAGFEVKEKELQVFPGGAKKGDWDVGIAMDAVRIGAKVDSVVLVSGDGDYVPVVNYLQQSLGCLVEVVAFGKTTSKALIDVCDDFIPIENHAKSLLFKTEKSVRSRSSNGSSSSTRTRARPAKRRAAKSPSRRR